MNSHQPTRSGLLLLLAFAIGLICMALGGCTANAMPPVNKPVALTQPVQLVAWLDTNAAIPFNQINFYAANFADTNWTLVGTAAATNGVPAVTNSQTVLQNLNSTKLYAAEATNTTADYAQFASDYLTATNTLGAPPAIALSRPLTLNLTRK